MNTENENRAEELNTEEVKAEEVITEEVQTEEAQAEEGKAEEGKAEEAAEEVVEETEDQKEIRRLRSELEKAMQQRDEYLSMAQRAQADYQNFKKRNSSVRTDALEEGSRETVAGMLPVIDNLERALEAAEDPDDPVANGVRMTLKQLMDILGKQGLEEIPAKGEKFDPDLHNAVLRASAEAGEPGTVAEVFQKGYRIKDKVIRYAMVSVVADE